MLESIHQSQLSLNLPELVKFNACGVASMVQVLNYFNIPYESPEKIFEDFLLMGKYTNRVLSLKFANFEKLSIPYTFFREDQSEKAIILDLEDWKNSRIVQEEFSVRIEAPNSHREYLPSFLLKTGSDSRGMLQFLQNRGLNVHLCEYSHQVSQDMKLKPNHFVYSQVKGFLRHFEREISGGALVIGSLKKTEIPYLKEISEKMYGPNSPELVTTHLMTLLKTQNKIYGIDPMVRDSNEAVHIINPTHLKNALTKGRGHCNFLAISQLQ